MCRALNREDLIEDERFGEVRQASPAAKFSDSPSRISGPAPLLGEHSVEILELLGYDEAKRDRLIQTGIVVTAWK